MFIFEFSKDPNHKGLMSFHVLSWKFKFILIHLQYQKYLYWEGNEEYLNYLKKKILQRQFWLKGNVCGCPDCVATYELLGRVHERNH